jgi:hypothetical protein
MCPMKKAIVAFVVLSIIALSAFGQVPKKVGQVPVYPGAKLVSARQEPAEAEIAAGKAPDFSFAAEKVWSSPDSADQVARFYAGKLGAAIGQEGGGDAGELSPGQETTIGLGVDYYDSSGLEDWPAQLRAGFAKRPKLSAEEGWARSASFTWAYKSADEDPYSFTLTIVDKSLSDEEPERYRQETEIRLSVRMFNQKKAAALLAPSAKDAEAYKADRQAQEAYGKEMKEKADQVDAQAKAQKAETDRVFGKAPTEAELGVPVYPGAAYDKDESVLRSGGSMEHGRCYAYFVKSSGDVRDTIEDVTRFYEQKTKRKRMELLAKDMSEIPLAYYPPKQKGDKPAVKDEVVVGYNGVNGMISIWILKDEEQSTAGGR